VVLEANACGLPVITIDHFMNNAKNLIKHGKNGYIVPFNTKTIAKKIVCLLSTNKYFYLSNNAKLNVKEFSWENVANNVEKMYRNLLNSK
jgi:glycosyltransferase involved in cell wall biosynthesis